LSLPDFLSRLRAYWQGYRFAGNGIAVFDPEAEERARERRALVYTIAMHLLLVLFLIISVNWKNSEPQAMQAEMWSPQQLAAATAAAQATAQREAQTFGDPEPKPEPTPEPKPATPPKPEPKPEPKPQPKPEPTPPKPQPKPEPAKTPANPKADIAIKKAEKEKPQDKPVEKKDTKAKDTKDVKDTKDDKKQQDARKKAQDAYLEELKREEQKTKQQAAQKQQAAVAAEARAQREAAMRAQAGAEAKATGAERARGDDRSYLAKLKTKIRGNVVLPPNLQGNPPSLFRVTQLPTGEVIDVRLIKSSGNAQLDAAVERAIRKSSPLPVPDGRAPDRIIDITYLPFEKPPQ
jgi:colicin import membrane protein